jgi:hypothetical protein
MKLYDNKDIILTVNDSTTVNLSYTVSDNNGCADIRTDTMTSTLFRASPVITCSPVIPVTNNLNCYKYFSRATSSCVGTSYNVTDTFQVWYFADSTGVASSTYSSGYWDAHVEAVDFSASSGPATSSNQNITVLTGLTVTTSTVNYGAMSANSTSSAANIATQTATTTNAGNSTTSIFLSELLDLNNTTGGNISSTYQHYATSSFSFGGTEQLLPASSSPALLVGIKLFTPSSTTATASTSRATFWGLNVPAGAQTGTYTGIDTFASQWAP